MGRKGEAMTLILLAVIAAAILASVVVVDDPKTDSEYTRKK